MIIAKNLVKNFAGFRAVDNVSFELRKGDILGFLGPNGAGKSTTMKMLTGFLPMTAGTVSVEGHDVQEAPMPAKRLFGYLPENGPLYQEMTVSEFLAFIAEVRFDRAEARAKAVDEAMDICNLRDVRNQTIETLSKGYRQRVGLAQAILHDPSYLIMDEPTEGLDPNQKQDTRKFIRAVSKDKGILLSTHVLEEVEAICNRVIIIHKGRIIADDTPAGLLKQHPDYGACRLAVAHVEAARLQESLEHMPEVKRLITSDDGLCIYPKGGHDLRKLLWDAAREKKWDVCALEPLPLKLDAVFHQLTSDERRAK